jgi:hypothetical protein
MKSTSQSNKLWLFSFLEGRDLLSKEVTQFLNASSFLYLRMTF